MTKLRDLRGRPSSLDPASIKGLRGYDAARKIREDFQDAPLAEPPYDLGCQWPTTVYEIGEGRSESYTSNKWKPSPRQFEDFKHVAESAQTHYLTDAGLRLFGGQLRDETPRGGWPRLRISVEMPEVVAELAPVLFWETRPFAETDGRRGTRFADHALRLIFPGCLTYAGRASAPPGRGGGSPVFLALIHRAHGVVALATGTHLKVTKDGICG